MHSDSVIITPCHPTLPHPPHPPTPAAVAGAVWRGGGSQQLRNCPRLWLWCVVCVFLSVHLRQLMGAKGASISGVTGGKGGVRVRRGFCWFFS